jgi:hypothetical protein
MKLLTENGRGKSDVPMIAGIVGLIASLPGILCAGCVGACTDTAQTMATGSSSGVGSTWALLNLGSAFIGLFYGIKSKQMPRTSGVVMVGVAIITFLLSFLTFNWFWGLIAIACFAIGGTISLTQEKVND